MLDIIIMLRNDFHLGGDQEGGIESNSKLTNEVDISRLQVLKELGGAWLSDCTEIGYELTFGHSNTIVNDFDDLSVFVVLNLNLQFSLIS